MSPTCGAALTNFPIDKPGAKPVLSIKGRSRRRRRFWIFLFAWNAAAAQARDRRGRVGGIMVWAEVGERRGTWAIGSRSARSSASQRGQAKAAEHQRGRQPSTSASTVVTGDYKLCSGAERACVTGTSSIKELVLAILCSLFSALKSNACHYHVYLKTLNNLH